MMNQMNQMPHYEMMGNNFLLWIIIGMLLALLLVAAITWLLASVRNQQRFSQVYYARRPQPVLHTYEQGYQPPEPARETSQTVEYSSPQSPYEQPTAQYPQEAPFQGYQQARK